MRITKDQRIALLEGRVKTKESELNRVYIALTKLKVECEELRDAYDKLNSDENEVPRPLRECKNCMRMRYCTVWRAAQNEVGTHTKLNCDYFIYYGG